MVTEKPLVVVNVVVDGVFSEFDNNVDWLTFMGVSVIIGDVEKTVVDGDGVSGVFCEVVVPTVVVITKIEHNIFYGIGW